MTIDSVIAGFEPSVFGEARERADALPGRPRRPFGQHFLAEWLALLAALTVVGAIIGFALAKTHRAADTTERDRLQIQARVIEENVGQQLDGINRALVSVREDFLGTPVYSVSSLLSLRLKALSDAIPGVRSMVLLDADGTVVATSVDALLGRDFSDRDYFRVPKADRNPATLYVASPYRTSLGNYTIVFARAIIAPNGSYAGTAIAALEPEYFEVLMRSVLYAPDMWVSLAHSNGKVFVTMPRDATQLEVAVAGEGESPAAATVEPPAPPRPAAGEARMTALRNVAPPELHMDRPLAITVSRAVTEVFRAWHQQALEYSIFFAILCAAAAFGLHSAQWRRKAFARLAASAARERRQSAEQLELAL